MANTQYVALLRGINVGGKSIIKMADLRACLDVQGLDDVATYIQSGNVLFSTNLSQAKVMSGLQSALLKTFRYNAPLALLSYQQIKDVVDQAPKGFGDQPDTYRYDVIFLIQPLTPAKALASISTKDGVDQVAAGPGVLYFSRLTSRATQSRLSHIMSLPIYKNMTIRNWNTTTKLLMLTTRTP